MKTIIERGASWTLEETKLLLRLWGKDLIERQETGAKRSKECYERIAEEFIKCGHERTADQVRTRIFNMIAEYRRITKEVNPERERKCIFFAPLHKIYQAKHMDQIKEALDDYEPDYDTSTRRPTIYCSDTGVLESEGEGGEATDGNDSTNSIIAHASSNSTQTKSNDSTIANQATATATSTTATTTTTTSNKNNAKANSNKDGDSNNNNNETESSGNAPQNHNQDTTPSPAPKRVKLESPKASTNQSTITSSSTPNSHSENTSLTNSTTKQNKTSSSSTPSSSAIQATATTSYAAAGAAAAATGPTPAQSQPTSSSLPTLPTATASTSGASAPASSSSAQRQQSLLLPNATPATSSSSTTPASTPINKLTTPGSNNTPSYININSTKLPIIRTNQLIGHSNGNESINLNGAATRLPTTAAISHQLYQAPVNTFDVTSSALLIDRMFAHLSRESENMREWIALEKERLALERTRRQQETEREVRRERVLIDTLMRFQDQWLSFLARLDPRIVENSTEHPPELRIPSKETSSPTDTSQGSGSNSTNHP